MPAAWPGNNTHEPKVLPGGIILLPTGLILAAQNEAELAGMLAHALAHSAGRHELGTAFYPVMFGASGLTPGRISAQRKFEIEADQEAVRLMAKAGYDPESLPSYVARVQKPAVGNVSRLFAAHASIEERVASIRSAASGLSIAEPALSGDVRSIQDELSKQAARQPRERPTLKRRP